MSNWNLKPDALKNIKDYPDVNEYIDVNLTLTWDYVPPTDLFKKCVIRELEDCFQVIALNPLTLTTQAKLKKLGWKRKCYLTDKKVYWQWDKNK